VSVPHNKLSVTVIGAGYLGSRHARRLTESPEFHLVSVCDTRGNRARALADELGCAAHSTAEEAIPGAEAVVVATDTSSHYAVASLALNSGKPVLVEKPLTGKIGDAESLVSRARETGSILHVGYVERFNPAIRRLIGRLPAPLFVESHRLAPLAPRNLDISVVQYLMIHDLDLALAFVGEDPVSVDGVGVPVVTGRVDIANARLRFPGGAVANLTASRVALGRVRKFRMFLPGTYVSADCAEGRGDVYRLQEGRDQALEKALQSGETVDIARLLDHHVEGREGGNALDAEHEAFGLAVHGKPNQGVTGAEALRSLRVLVAVEAEIEKGLRRLG